jgi:hypothetical protein
MNGVAETLEVLWNLIEAHRVRAGQLEAQINAQAQRIGELEAKLASQNGTLEKIET